MLVVAELSEADLGELIEQAVVDAYGDDEQMAGSLPVPAPPGSKWIAAYRRWAGGQ